MNFLDIIKHLLPNAKAWVITIEKRLKEFFSGLTGLGEDAKEFTDDAWLDIFPQTTREISAWELQFGLGQVNTLTEQQKRDRLAAAWSATGGQSPSYIQGVLQENGFDVYLHDWWVPGTEPLPGVVGCVTPKPMTFTRASVATVVNASGVLVNLAVDVPAFKADGFYPEGEAENLTTFSEDLSQWTKDALATLVSDGIGPDNVSTPLKFTTDVGSSVLWDWGPTATVSFTIGGIYTFDFFVKDNGGQFVAINLPDAQFGTDSDVSYDLVNGIVGNNQGSKPAEIEELIGAPGWFRISMTLECTASGSATADLVAVIGGGTSLTTTGDGTGFFSYGAQTTLRGFKSKYNRTTGSTVTRADEICSVLASEFLPNAKDTFTLIANVFIERLSDSTSASDRQTIFNALDNTNLNLFISDDDILFFNGNVGDGQGTYGVTASSVLTTGSHEIIALRRSSTAIEIWLDGVMVAQNTSNVAPIEADYTTELAHIGSRVTTEDRFLNVPTNNMAIYHRDLSSGEITAQNFIDANVIVPLISNLDYSNSVKARNPFTYLRPSNIPGLGVEPDGYPLVNKIIRTVPDPFVLCGEVDVLCGEPDAQCGNFLAFKEILRPYTIPMDISKYPYFLYIGGQTFPDQASIPASRQDEFEDLCLKLCPMQQWLGILVTFT